MWYSWEIYLRIGDVENELLDFCDRISNDRNQMECVTEPNVFAFKIPQIKVIAPLGKHSDRTIECRNVLGCI